MSYCDPRAVGPLPVHERRLLLTDSADGSTSGAPLVMRATPHNVHIRMGANAAEHGTAQTFHRLGPARVCVRCHFWHFQPRLFSAQFSGSEIACFAIPSTAPELSAHTTHLHAVSLVSVWPPGFGSVHTLTRQPSIVLRWLIGVLR